MQFEEEYIRLLQEELIPAMGCTEPIAIAFAAAKARELLEVFPENIVIKCSGNIIKNVQGVVVPNTGNLRGIEVAAIAGALYGSSEKGLEVLRDIPNEKIVQIREKANSGLCTVYHLEDADPLEIHIIVQAGKTQAEVRLREKHTNIVYISKNGQVLLEKNSPEQEANAGGTAYESLTMDGIFDFSKNVEISRVKAILDRQIEYNHKIAEEGLSNDYGAAIGKTIIENTEGSVENLARAYAAAGSDARMSGCEMPVVINCGSGNQGLTVSLPVLIYAESLKAENDKRYRALLISNLTALHVKSVIGRLSAFCGVVSAASGAGAAITYLKGGDENEMKQAVSNTLAIASGMVCDGAKPSCAAKIAVAVEAAIISSNMALKGRTFQAGEGLVKKDIERTILAFGNMARNGMQQTDREILRIMLEQ